MSKHVPLYFSFSNAVVYSRYLLAGLSNWLMAMDFWSMIDNIGVRIVYTTVIMTVFFLYARRKSDD